MAKIDNEFLSLRGLVNGVVFRNTKYGKTASSYNSGVYKDRKWSQKQLLARDKFKFLTTMAKVFREACDVGFRLEMKQSSSPCFVRNNYAAVDVKDKDVFVVDYDRLCFSRGVVPAIDGINYEVNRNDVNFEWRCGEGIGKSCEDAVVVVAYCREAKRCDGLADVGDGAVWHGKTKRNDCKLSVVLPRKWDGLEVRFYAFAVNADGKSSDSQIVVAK